MDALMAILRAKQAEEDVSPRRRAICHPSNTLRVRSLTMRPPAPLILCYSLASFPFTCSRSLLLDVSCSSLPVPFCAPCSASPNSSRPGSSCCRCTRSVKVL